MSGLFVTIEGGEGVGKSTFSGLLLQTLKLRGIAAHGTREPGGSPMADRIRQIFVAPAESDALKPEAELFLISAARAQHMAYTILPRLSRGEWIICDRFADSTRVYQGELGGIDPTFLERVIAASTYGAEPSLTFLLDCPVEVALQRIGQSCASSTERSGAARYDLAEAKVHERMRAAYRNVAARFPERIVTLDGQLPSRTLVEQALVILETRTKGKV